MFTEGDYKTRIYIHNEIFKELEVIYDKGSSHVAFAYSHYFLICWLYRYAKYSEWNVDVKWIKQMLGYNPTNKKIDYLIKKGGLLDQIGLTRISNDFPVSWSMQEDDLEFMMYSELDDVMKGYLKKCNIKVPIKAVERTFYDISNTHEMKFDLFIKCMESDLGCSGFYLCGYLKYKCDKFGEYCVSFERLAADIGMSKSTVQKYIGLLLDHSLISYKENACRLVDGQFNKLGNSYKVNF